MIVRATGIFWEKNKLKQKFWQDSINVYSFIARVAYQLAQALYIDMREHTFWHSHIDTTPKINYCFGL